MPIEGVDHTIYMKRNRKIESDPAYIRFFHHGAEVLKVSRCRSHIVIDAHGRESQFTKNAINDGLRSAGIPAYVFQADFVWFLKRRNHITLRTTESFIQSGAVIKLI